MNTVEIKSSYTTNLVAWRITHQPELDMENWTLDWKGSYCASLYYL
jgi:hypothetical protein